MEQPSGELHEKQKRKRYDRRQTALVQILDKEEEKYPVLKNLQHAMQTITGTETMCRVT